ncbi:endonuclease/exonuclease/phosphatase family protein [Streptomyces sp. NPDC004111]|uniref:endonuclease/exonuclease/phosphatase family protein n=1 Tax=Streptomyces sp. NPDC004111 TaxID=3364690 RepID=UPI00368FCC09
MTKTDTPRGERAGRDGPGDSGVPDGRATGRRRARVRRALAPLATPAPWRRGRVLAGSALLLGLVMLGHGWLTDFGGLGSLVETFLPWSALGVLVLLAAALWRRSASAVVALLLPALVWAGLFGGLLGDRSRAGGDLTVVSHNVGAENADPAGTARALAASGADLLALQELTGEAEPVYEKALAEAYPHHTVRGTVGLWSRLPLSGTRTVDVAMQGMAGPLAAHLTPEERAATPRALRTTVATERGPLVVYVAHLGSVRVNPRAGFSTDQRDEGARSLARAVAAERGARVVLLGDLNGTTDDRAFAPLTSRLRSVQDAAGDGFGFSWPAAFPVARIDQVLVRGVEPVGAWLLARTGSDHLPVAARIGW